MLNCMYMFQTLMNVYNNYTFCCIKMQPECIPCARAISEYLKRELLLKGMQMGSFCFKELTRSLLLTTCMLLTNPVLT